MDQKQLDTFIEKHPDGVFMFVESNKINFETYKDGKKNGPYKVYSSPSRLACIKIPSKNDITDANQLLHNGMQLINDGTYKDDELDGEQLEFYENGRPRVKAFCTDGRVNGEYLEYHENGELREKKFYANGVLGGEYLEYHENGKLRQKQFYKNDKLNGESLYFNEKGQLFEKCFYVDGVKEGVYQSWYDNGQMECESNYANNKIVGVYKRWNKDGKLIFHNDGEKTLLSLDDNGRNCALPDGEITCWKACKTYSGLHVYVKLLVPAEAKRVTSLHGEARVEYAKVQQIIDKYGQECKLAFSFAYTRDYEYSFRVGNIVKPDKYDHDWHTWGYGVKVVLHKDMCNKDFSY